uniref:Sodium/hydrogen exchanger n=1 Tax=Heterorhabditis bacteriophora TaxID=37862 RepID=A0A1I7XAQ5_HETBA
MGWQCGIVLIFVLFCYAAAHEEYNSNQTRFQARHFDLLENVVTFRWESIETPYMITTWLLLASLAKILFHVFKPISNVLPDSSLLIVVGLVVGLLLKESGANISYNLDSHAFFLYLLPPIIFDAEIHVNEFLFVNVFGEALFNDGVTVMFKSFTLIGGENLQPIDYGAGALSFFVVACGGALLGIIFAIAVCLTTKYTNKVRILAPVFIFVIPYMAYLTAEMTSFSSIIAKLIAVCGMAMKQYVKGNITQVAANSVKYFIKMLAQSSETVIFMFLGLSTMYSDHYWDTGFVLATLVFCLLWRTIGVVVQCFILNRFRHKKFTKVDQFVLSYGGLRGAIAFGLAVSMPDTIPAKKMFITTTIVVIYFTVFLQKLQQYHSIILFITNFKITYNYFERFNAKILRPILMRNEQKKNFDASTIVRAYAKITLEDAMNLTKAQKYENKRLSALRGSGISHFFILISLFYNWFHSEIAKSIF